MPITIAVRFLAGRYHATPYGHHVNEGLIEWPPSPWRLLRALISVGYTSGAWSGAGPPTVARGLIEKLSAELPHYHVPSAIGAHSRHYMPVGVLDSKTKIEKTTLVFDTWARVGRVAPGDCSPEALTRSGQGDFHHPAPPLMCLVATPPISARQPAGGEAGSVPTIG